MLKNPKKADLDKDGKLSGYEKKRGMAIEKAMAGKKPMKAALGVLALGLGAKKMKEKGKSIPPGLGAAALIAKKKKALLGKRKGGLSDLPKDPTKTINSVKPSVGRRMTEGAVKAAKATRVGKIAAGVAAAALLGKAALEKMYEKRTGKKPFTKRPKKKMGGGMMMKRPMMARVGAMAGRDTAKKLKEARKKRKADVIKGMGGYMGGGLTEATQRLKAQGKMGGGMMSLPMGYKKGKSVMAKGCKLGRKKPTKLY